MSIMVVVSGVFLAWLWLNVAMLCGRDGGSIVCSKSEMANGVFLFVWCFVSGENSSKM